MIKRAAAGAIDLVLGLLLCHFLQWRVGYYFASRAAPTFNIGAPDSLWKGPFWMIVGIFGVFFYTLPFAFFLYFLPEALWGRSLGKWLFGLKISGPDRSSLWKRYLLKTILFWGITLGLIIGSFPVVVLATLGGLTSLLFALPDRLAKTAVS